MKPRNWLEWVLFGFGVLVVLGSVGYLAYDAATSERRPPRVSVALGAADRQGEQYAVPVTVRNDGGQTAEQVQVEVRLAAGDQTDVRELLVEFLPRGSEREGWVVFRRDPAAPGARLEGEVLGYEQP